MELYMSDEISPGPSRTWLERISQVFSGEPKDINQLLDILRDAEQRQLLDTDALRMIEGVLQVSEMRVEEVMIPRTEMVVIDKDATLEEMLPIVLKSAHSRFPVIGESKDEIVGILLAKDLLKYQHPTQSEKLSLKDLIRPAVFIPESKRLDILLNEFRNNKNHLAIVVDEYGGVSGMVTIEDVLEQIVGDIEDEHDVKEDPYIRKHKEYNYTIKGQTPVEVFNDYFSLQFSDEEFDTIGGLVSNGLGHLPQRGEAITINGILFTVLRANQRRIQLLKITFLPSENTSL